MRPPVFGGLLYVHWRIDLNDPKVVYCLTQAIPVY